MSAKIAKHVLIVDDESRMREILCDAFNDFNSDNDCPYNFEVDAAQSAEDCIAKVRARSKNKKELPYDVIVLDTRMEEETSGLKASFELYHQLGSQPVRIIFTGYPNFQQCVKAMRFGAWDYILKEDVGEIRTTAVVVKSALTRLQQLDMRKTQRQVIIDEWLPKHLHELQATYGGRMIAFWHQPEVAIIASGDDVFSLEGELKEWRQQHLDWEEPYIVMITAPSSVGEG